ncbi:MerR family transcriptional regulator [bacterium]|nr:MerR family transcriptional regulator [bacterium]
MVQNSIEYLTIGQLAKAADINLQTIRYYERIKLLPKPKTKESGYRQYTPQDLSRLLFVKRAKELGFTLKEIGLLLTLKVDKKKTCADVREMAESAIIMIQGKIQTLDKFVQALNQLAKQCHGVGPTSECPILEFLEDEHLKSKDEI